jgi:hypothetical protein
MKRLLLTFVAALAAAALVTQSVTAANVVGPPCTNVVAGGDTLGYVSPNPSTGTTGSGIVEASFILAGNACKAATYSLSIYSFDGSTPLVENVEPASITGNVVFFHYEFTSGAPADGVCLVGTTSLGRLWDRVPDSGCAPVENGSSGGFSDWN